MYGGFFEEYLEARLEVPVDLKGIQGASVMFEGVSGSILADFKTFQEASRHFNALNRY